MSRRARRSRNTLGIRTFACLLAVLAVVAGTAAPAGAATAATLLSTAPATVPADGSALATAPVDAAAPVSASPDDAARAAAPVDTGIAKATLAGFNAGNIISDAVFTNKGTMTEAQIQAFFNSQVSRCRGGTDEKGRAIVCLKDFRIDSVTRPADAYCSGYTGARNESAARIIYRVAQSCNINPQVLIVMLQKEQGLVTHTWPSAWRYDIALGQGCPDTAPCDPNFVGFFHQIYGAARQMQIYMEGRWFQWYAPGRTWNVLYNPNQGCGASPVFIANKATAALYYYTPYQPNAAALRAGYGAGDACSAYGNRNFYNYFTDWFGSTQNTASQILRAGVDIYYVSGGVRYHITAEDWPEYRAKFGNYRTVVSVAGYTDGGTTSRFVRNTSTGVIAYFDAGKTHRFASCDLVAAWGGSCNRVVQMSNSDFAKIGAGPEMTRFARIAARGNVYQITGRTLRPLQDAAARIAFNGGKVDPFAPVMAPASRSLFAVSTQVRFAPGQFVSVAGVAGVHLATQDGRLLSLPSWDLARDMGLAPTKIDVSAASVSGRQRGALGPIFVCGDRTYIAAGGGFALLARGNTTGVTATVLDAPTCARLKLDAPQVAGEVFVRFGGTDAVFHVTGGVTRLVRTMEQLRSLAGGVNPRVVSLRAGSVSAFTAGTPYPRGEFAPGQFVSVAGVAGVHLATQDGRLLSLPSWDLARDMGLAPTKIDVSAASVSGRQRGALGPIFVCGDRTYIAAGGGLALLARGNTTGVTATVLDAPTCARLKLDAPQVAGEVFVRFGGTDAVFHVTGGVTRLVRTMEQLRSLAGGVNPRVVSLRAGSVSAFTAGTPYPRGEFAPGQFVSVAGVAGVHLATQDGRLLSLPSWDLARDMGLAPTKIDVSAASVSGRQRGALGPIFVCGDRTYIAAGGGFALLARGNTTGVTATVLDAPTCARLKLDAPQVAGEVFVRFGGTDAVFHVTGGVTRLVRTMEQLRSLAGGVNPTIVSLRAGSASAFTAGASYTPAGSLVRADGTPEVYLVDGLTLVHLPSWDVATAFGIPRTAQVERPSALSPFERRPALSTLVTCNGTTFSASRGTFTRVTPPAGAAVTALTPATCAALKIG